MPERPGPDQQELGELLQELRVALPGVQVMLAVLLTVPFSSGFAGLSEFDRLIFFTAVLAAAISAGLLIAPSAHHRFAWPIPPSETERLVRLGTMEARAGLLALAWTMTAAAGVVADLIVGGIVALLTGLVVGGITLALWIALPLLRKRRPR